MFKYQTTNGVKFESAIEGLTGIIVDGEKIVSESKAKNLVQARRDYLRRNPEASVAVMEVELQPEPKKRERKPLTEADREKNLADTLERVQQEKHFCPTHGQLAPEGLSKAYARRRVIRCRKCENARSSAQKAARKA